MAKKGYKADFKISKETIDMFKRALIQRADLKAQNYTKQIAAFYLDEVNKFYNEYSPILYKRHPYSNIANSGMAKTFNMIMKRSFQHNRYIVYGGISLHTYNMYSDYRGQKDWVLYTFTQGIHGLPGHMDAWGYYHPAIQGHVKPLKDTKEFIAKLKKEDNKKMLNLIKQTRM